MPDHYTPADAATATEPWWTARRGIPAGNDNHYDTGHSLRCGSGSLTFTTTALVGVSERRGIMAVMNILLQTAPSGLGYPPLLDVQLPATVNCTVMGG